MGREMKLIFLSFLPLLLCFGAKISNADTGKDIEWKRKFISISNKAKDDVVIQCKSGTLNFNKTLKPSETIRWGLLKKAGEMGPTAICHVDVRSKGEGEGVGGYLSAFIEKECKRECKWRVLDGGVLKLKVLGGEWKSFQLKEDEEVARSSNEDRSCDDDDDDGDLPPGNRGFQGWGNLQPSRSPAPAPVADSEVVVGANVAPSPIKGEGKSRSKDRKGKKSKARRRRRKQTKKRPSLAPPPAPSPSSTEWIAPSPTNQVKRGRKLNPRNPRSPLSAKQDHATPPTNQIKNSPSPPPTEQIEKAQSPAKHGRRKLNPKNPSSLLPKQSPAPSPPANQFEDAPENADTAPPPTKHGHRKSRNGTFPKWKSPTPALSDWKAKSASPPTAELAPPPRKANPVTAPAAAEGGEESEMLDGELPPLPPPGSTFYTCIKEDYT